MAFSGVSTVLTVEWQKSCGGRATGEDVTRKRMPLARSIEHRPSATEQKINVPQTISHIRRRNLLLQLHQYTRKQLDSGVETGSATSFAQAIGVHKSLLSKLKGEEGKAGTRDISDSMARQIEAALGLKPGWMDEVHDEAPLTSAEQSFVAMALEAYRRTDAAGRSSLRKLVKDFPSKT